MPELNGNGHKQIEDPIAEASFQRRAVEGYLGGVYSWWFTRPVDDWVEVSPYWSEQRDRDLRLFWMREGNDILQGCISSMIKWAKNLAWVCEGPDRVVNRYQELLSDSEFGQGWGELMSKTFTDYYTQDKGATWELIGAGDPNGPIQGPVLGIAHLDAQFVQPTGDPVYPIIFRNMKDGAETYHRIHATRCVRIVDMPSPNELLCGVGFSATSRVLASSQVLLKLARFKNEKLSDMPEAGLLLLNNLLPKQWDDAKANHERGRRKLGQEIWSNIMTLFSIDPAQPASADFVSFANIPDGFEELTSTNIYVSVVALAFGVDPREFWPMSSGSLGSGRESEVMAEKAKGKGKADVIAAVERAINWRVLPPSVNFRFDFRNDEEDRLKAEINSKKVESIWRMWDSEAYRAGLPPPIGMHEIRQMLADNVPDYFKPEFMEAPINDEVERTDTEREDKAARVEVDHKGITRRKGVKRIDMLLDMADENFKAGRINREQYLEFALGKAIDERE